MKQRNLVMAITLTLGGLASAPAFSTIPPGVTPGGDVNFTGEVTNMTCLIEGQTPNGAIDISVPLDKVSVSELLNAGDTAKPMPFSIRLGGPGDLNCVDGSVASVRFESTSPAIDNTTGWLTNTDTTSNGATNVQIQILNADNNNPINLTDNTNNHAPKTIVDQTAVYSYVGQYVAVGGAATPGLVSSTVKYSIVYQ